MSTKIRALLVGALATLAAGCSSGGSGSHGGASIAPASSHNGATPTSSTTTTTTTATTPPLPAVAAPGVVPLIIVHGHGAGPDGFGPFLDRYAQGYVQVPELEALEADQLKPGDLPKACVVCAAYYKESKTGVLYDLVNGVGTGSIGSCPTPRDDGRAGNYPISYAQRLARIVDGVRRATGSDRVDIMGHSMGTIVSRAYTRWLSQGAAGGQSKVRRLLLLAGPNRGLNALEAFVDGFENGSPREFMRLGENAEMCAEYKGWQGQSYIDRLNDNWDAACGQLGVVYGGVTALGAFGPQVQPPPLPPPPPPGPFGIKLSGSFNDLWQALMGINLTSFPDAIPYFSIMIPNIVTEFTDALGPSDDTVRIAISRLDQPPFLGHAFYATFEGRHGDEWNPEQGCHASTFTAELARQFFLTGHPASGTATAALRLIDAPGKASWIAVDTSVANGAISAQLVEEKLDAQGNVVGGAQGFGFPVADGEQHAFVRVDAGGGKRTYHLVVYGANGILATKDETLTLTDGALETAPSTTLATTSSLQGPSGPAVTATFASNATDPTLRFSYRLDGGAWSAWDVPASFTTPPLGPGEHRLDARSRHGANAAAVVAEDARGASIGIFVDTGGAVTIRK